AIKVYDVLGRLVATLVNEYRRQGIHTVQWDAVGLPSGAYFYQLQADGLFETRKMVLTK
ncbi:MAG: 5'-Nucleotidase domain protein, partial [Bacteroidetes bacterium]|nr:5'-Nucleotidase domain protein [Bacteroidota bacterium]